MIDQILSSNKTLEQKLYKLECYVKDPRFLDDVFYPENFLKAFIPFAIYVLRTCEPERNNPKSINNSSRRFILTTLSKFILKDVDGRELFIELNKVLENDNIQNIRIALKLFTAIGKSRAVMNDNIDYHFNVLCNLCKVIFLQMDCTNEKTVEDSLITLTQYFLYINDILQKGNINEGKIDVIISSAIVGFKRAFDKRKQLDFLCHKKNLLYEFMLSITKFMKLLCESKVHVNFSNQNSLHVYDMAKFSVFKCPNEAIDLKKEMYMYIFKFLTKSRENVVTKVVEFFDLRLFYSPDSYILNYKGLLGLTDLAKIYADIIDKRIFSELIGRTGEIIETSYNILIDYITNSSDPSNVEKQALEFLDVKSASNSVHDKSIRYEKSFILHIEIISHCVDSINSQCFMFSRRDFQKTESMNFYYKQFKLLYKTIVLLYKMSITFQNEDLLIYIKKIFYGISKPIREMFSKLGEIVKTPADFAYTSSFKADKLFSLLDMSLEILRNKIFKNEDIAHPDDFFAIFFLPVDILFIDVLSRQIFKIIRYSIHKSLFFIIWKKTCTESKNASRFLDISVETVLEMLVYDEIVSCNNSEKRKIFTSVLFGNHVALFAEESRMRMSDENLFYSKAFELILEIMNNSTSHVNKHAIKSFGACIEVMAKSNNLKLHKILFEVFKKLQVLYDKLRFFQMYFFKNFRSLFTRFDHLFKKTKDPLYLRLILFMPFNLNLLMADLSIFIENSLICIQYDNDLAKEALETLLHILENTTQEAFSNLDRVTMFILFDSIFQCLKKEGLFAVSARIYGRIKNYQKVFSSNFYLYHDKSYTYGTTCLMAGGSLFNVIVFDQVLVNAISDIHGAYTYNKFNRIADFRDLETYKKRLPAPICLHHRESVNLIVDFLNRVIEFLECGISLDCLKNTIHDSIKYNERSASSSIHPKFNPNEYVAKFGSQLVNSELSNRLQYIYDSIVCLFAYTEHFSYEPVKRAISFIYEFISHIIYADYYSIYCYEYGFLVDIFIDAFLEGFSFEYNHYSFKLLKDILSYSCKMKGGCNEFYTIYILDLLFYKISHLCISKSERKKDAGLNSLIGLFEWDLIPGDWLKSKFLAFLETIFQSLDGDCISTTKHQSIATKIIHKVACLLSKTDKSTIAVFILDRLLYGEGCVRKLAKKLIKAFTEAVKLETNSAITDTIKQYLEFMDNIKTITDVLDKIDVLVFISKKFSSFIDQEDLFEFIKVYYFYIEKLFLSEKFNRTINFFCSNIKYSSDEYLEFEKKLIESEDIISDLYLSLGKYELSNILESGSVTALKSSDIDKSIFYNYLISEIIYIYISNSITVASVDLPFDYLFYNVPFGILAPIKKLCIDRPDVIKILKKKYEAALSAPITVYTLKELLFILNIIEIEADERLLDVILKALSDFKTQREVCIFTDNYDNSALSKAFELALIYPQQDSLFESVISIFNLFQQFSKTFVWRILPCMCKYAEANSGIIFPFIIRKCVSLSLYDFIKYLHDKSILFRNYAININPAIIEELILSLRDIDFNNIADLLKTCNFFSFLRLVDYDVNKQIINTSLFVYEELKKKNRGIETMKKFFRFCINKFGQYEIEKLYTLDPLFKMYNKINVKVFDGIKNKGTMSSMLCSLNKRDVKSFENLIRFFGDQSWMLCDVFVETMFCSKNMLTYCKNNLQNLNIRSSLLYYLCTFEPKDIYFDLLLQMPVEERRCMLYCLKKIIDVYNPAIFEEIIFNYLADESRTKMNTCVIYPILYSNPELCTEKMTFELIQAENRFLSGFVSTHQKVGLQTFNLLYTFFYGKYEGEKCSTEDSWNIFYKKVVASKFYEQMKDLYTLLFINFVHLPKATILSHF